MSGKNKKKISEAGNRTPVARVTGGNTRPLYYFGSDFRFSSFLICFLFLCEKLNTGSFQDKTKHSYSNHKQNTVSIILNTLQKILTTPDFVYNTNTIINKG